MITDAPRAARFGAPRRVSRDGVATSLRSRVRALRSDVADVLAVDVETLGPADPRALFSADHVTELSRLCVGRASVWAVTGEGPVASALALALDLEELAMDLEADAIADRTHRLSECATGLGRLRMIPSTSDLLDAASEEVVARCGFGRAVVSRVEEGAWVPMTAHFAADGDWFGEFAGHGIPLHGHTPEARMLTERLPAVVTDTSQGSVHREIIVEAGRSMSYVVAPLLIDGRVVGFIHADHFPDNHRTDDIDRDVLCSFTMGLARAHERLVLMERIRAQRAKVDRVLGTAMRGLGEGVDLAVMSTGGQLVAARPEIAADLTARERDVLSLIVDGATNQEIARQLIIAPDTVKCHVKQILRKFGVANRAQVIACAAGTALV